MTLITFVPMQILYIYPKSNLGDLDEYLNLRGESFSVKLLNDKNLLLWFPGLETPQLDPNSFLLL